MSASSGEVVLVFVHPTPYRRSFLDALARMARAPFEVIYLEAGGPERPWKSSATAGRERISRGWRVGAGRFLTRVAIDPIAMALRNRPGFVVLNGYSDIANQATAWLCRLRGIPYGFLVESNAGPTRTRAQRLLRRLLVEPLLRGGTHHFASGSRAKAYLVGLGVRAERISYLPNTAPLREPFERRAGSHPARFLFVGRLVADKAVELLVAAWRKVEAAEPDCELWVAGDGPLRSAVQNSGCERLRWLGFREPEEIDRMYGECDALVLPSAYETWGAVVCEALGRGLPVIVSDAVGCAPDVVRDGVNGIVFPSGDAGALTAAMRRFAADREYRTELARHAQEGLRGWDTESVAAQVAETLQNLVARRA